MSKTTKGLLVVTIVCLVVGGALNTGLVNAHNIDGLYAILPLGAVFAGLFLIVRVLEKESASYDVEQQSHAAGPQSSAAQRPAASGRTAQQAHVGTNP
jgi:Na+-driven multidrug efflux pump